MDTKTYYFRINVYFTEYLLAIEIDEKGHKGRNLILEEKRQKALEKKTGCEFIRINTSVMMKIMQLVECKHLPVNLKTVN